MASNYTALVLDAGLCATLSVLRALRADGATVHLAVRAGSIGAARHSGHCARHVVHPPLGDGDEWIDTLLAFVKRHGVDVVLPLTDDATAALDRARGRLEPHVALAIPPAQAVADSLDKVRTLDVARRVPDAFAVPQTLAPGAPSDVDPADVATWPVLVKPRSADGARGIHLVTDAAQLRPVYDAVHRLYPRPLIQERMRYGPGDKYQLYYLFDGAGRLAAQFMQRILHEARGITGPEGTWQRGGISLQWESSHDADMLARGQRLLEAMEWRGTAFVEVVRDRRDGRLKLLEINPRLSGSIHLCLACGPNLAAGVCRVALGRPVPRQLDFPVGRRARRDLIHMLQAGAWRALFDLRFRPPNRLLADPLPFAAASVGRLNPWMPRRVEI